MKRIVITGLGACTPIGKNMQEFSAGLKLGKSGAGAITHFDASKHKTRFACEIKDYNPQEYFDRKEIRKMDLYSQYAMIAADEAVLDSEISGVIEKERVGVIWSSGIGGMQVFEEQVGEFIRGNGEPRFSPFFITNMIPNMAAGLISIKYGFMGPNFAPVSACTSSAHAIIVGAMLIQTGQAECIIAGGSEASITSAAIGGFNSLKALSTQNDSPETASKPFDKGRDGFVLGEGAGAFVLEDYESAKKRGASIYAEITGYGMSADAYHMTAPHPEGAGAMLSMQLALKMANLRPEQIDLFNVHATSTPIGDVSELSALNKLLGNTAKKPYLIAPKSMLGHLLGAAGAVEALVSVLALKNSMVPPTINTLNPEEDVKNFKLNSEIKEHVELRYSLSNNFGFGGHNASIVFKRFEE